MQSIAPHDLIPFQDYCLAQQLDWAIISREGAPGSYGNASTPVRSGKPWNYRVYFGIAKRDFLRHWSENNQDMIGESLGYPKCCIEFFKKYWVEEGWRDLTYPMLLTPIQDGAAWNYHCNILLRHLGLRGVFHLPCSFSCHETQLVSEAILDYASRLGFREEVSWLREILQWPVEWSSLHGVAIVKTPVFKIVYSSDPLPAEKKVELTGPFVPAIPLTFITPDTWTDNGFTNLIDQNRAHQTVMTAVGAAYSDSGRILDLGCGNGVLLEKISKKHPYLIPYGVEVDLNRFERASTRLKYNIHNCSISDVKEYLQDTFQIILISANRFQEMDQVAIDLLLRHLRSHTQFLVIYVYGSWQDKLDEVFTRHFSLTHIEPSPYAEARIYKPR